MKKKSELFEEIYFLIQNIGTDLLGITQNNDKCDLMLMNKYMNTDKSITYYQYV